MHAEDATTIDDAPGARRRSYADFLASRPPAAEDTAIADGDRRWPRRPARAMHILHLSTAGSLPLLAQAKADGVRVTVETCPHYLTLDAGQVPDGATEFKCCPPIRDAANRDRLWAGPRGRD